MDQSFTFDTPHLCPRLGADLRNPKGGLVGCFLTAASITKQLTCCVESTRDTKSFSTRQVKVLQEGNNGDQRVSQIILIDFHLKEPALMTYSSPPSRSYSSLENCVPSAQVKDRLVAVGTISAKEAEVYDRFVGSVLLRFFEQLPCPEGISAQTLAGVGKNVRTTQENLHVSAKTSAEWIRNRIQLVTRADKVSGLAFFMDTALSFLPLMHSHRFLDDVGPCASLDFALRIFDDDASLNDWHLREMQTICAANGVTYSESRLWNDDGGHGSVNDTELYFTSKARECGSFVRTAVEIRADFNLKSVLARAWLSTE